MLWPEISEAIAFLSFGIKLCSFHFMHILILRLNLKCSIWRLSISKELKELLYHIDKPACLMLYASLMSFFDMSQIFT